MGLIAFLFGVVFGLTVAISLVLVSVYNLLYHSVPPEELRAFIREIKVTVRSYRRKKK